jgi:hypothetical protein
MAGFVFFEYNRTRNWSHWLPDRVAIEGTVRCADNHLVLINHTIPFDVSLTVDRIISDHVCISRLLNRTRLHHDASISKRRWRCQDGITWISSHRVRDGFRDCVCMAMMSSPITQRYRPVMLSHILDFVVRMINHCV